MEKGQRTACDALISVTGTWNIQRNVKEASEEYVSPSITRSFTSEKYVRATTSYVVIQPTFIQPIEIAFHKFMCPFTRYIILCYYYNGTIAQFCSLWFTARSERATDRKLENFPYLRRESNAQRSTYCLLSVMVCQLNAKIENNWTKNTPNICHWIVFASDIEYEPSIPSLAYIYIHLHFVDAVSAYVICFHSISHFRCQNETRIEMEFKYSVLFMVSRFVSLFSLLTR